MASNVNSDLVPELRPGKCFHLEYVVQEFYDIQSARAHVLDLRSRGKTLQKMVPDVLHAGSRGTDDVVELGKILHEQFFGRHGIFQASIVRHGQAATGLVQWEGNIHIKPLEQFERCDTDFGREGVNVTGDEKADFHACPPGDLHTPIFKFACARSYYCLVAYPAGG